MEKPKTTLVSPNEKETQKAILEYLQLRGFFCWRNNTGGFTDKRDHYYQFGKVGSGDILGLTKDGILFSIEVKRAGGHPTQNQLDFIGQINRNKGIAFVARSIDDVEKYFPLIDNV